MDAWTKFQELKVWQAGKDLAVSVYRLTGEGVFQKDFGLRDQIRRAAVSVPSNIAEGDERDTDKEAVRFFYIAKGSTAEVLTQAIIALEIGYINQQVFDDLKGRCLLISKMLSRLIAARAAT
jgi:four helix bundle protein